MLIKMQPYRLVLIVAPKDHDKGIDDLITFLLGAPKDCPLKKFCAVDPEHTTRYPRPKVRRELGGLIAIEFIVAEPETDETLAQKLVPLFFKNGWVPMGVRRVEKTP
jgi:hypothetical protein